MGVGGPSKHYGNGPSNEPVKPLLAHYRMLAGGGGGPGGGWGAIGVQNYFRH